jgi:hypothetical protein
MEAFFQISYIGNYLRKRYHLIFSYVMLLMILNEWCSSLFEGRTFNMFSNDLCIGFDHWFCFLTLIILVLTPKGHGIHILDDE